MSKTNDKNKQVIEINTGKSALIGGIEDDAKKEAASILAAAEKAKEERILARDKQVATILGDAKAKAKAQAEMIAKNNASLISVETKRKALRMQEQIIGEILEEAQKKIGTLVTSADYANTLKSWIVEGAAGIFAEAASVNASANEKPKITAKLLRESETEAERLSGRKIALSLSDAQPLANLGITVTSSDGKTAFNNQVHTRLLRYQAEIRKLIYRELFGE
jgi:vacuolar-type H+-ATPase subunit E/Vma4